MKANTFQVVLPAIGASSNRGAMGWCNISIIQSDMQYHPPTQDQHDRAELLAAGKMEIAPARIDTVFLRTCTRPRCNMRCSWGDRYRPENWNMPLADKGSGPYIPYGMIKYYEKRFTTFIEGEAPAPGLRTVALPGHTPGISGVVLEKERVILTGDAVKNAYDYTHGIPPYAIYDGAAGLKSYTKIPAVADVIVPGHGRPFTVQECRISYVGGQKPVDIRIFPNQEHLDDLEERVFQRIVL